MSSGGLGDHRVLRVNWIIRRRGRGRCREVAIERLWYRVRPERRECLVDHVGFVHHRRQRLHGVVKWTP
jgi:hypothetical protein